MQKKKLGRKKKKTQWGAAALAPPPISFSQMYGKAIVHGASYQLLIATRDNTVVLIM